MSEKIHYKLVHDFDREVEVDIVKSRFLENKETAYFMSSSIGLVDELSNFQTINGMDRKISKLEAQLKEANEVASTLGSWASAAQDDHGCCKELKDSFLGLLEYLEKYSVDTYCSSSRDTPTDILTLDI